MTSEISLESVFPLVAERRQEGKRLVVTFRCPATAATFHATAPLRRSEDVGDQLKAQAEKSLMSSLRRGVARTLRSALGYGVLGRVGADLASAALDDVEKSKSERFSEEEENAALLEAFKSVQRSFVWEEKGGRWVSAQATGLMTEFQQRMNRAPVNERYDRGTLARMLIEVATVDGVLSEEEKDFLRDFVTPDLGTVEELAERPPLSLTELAEVSEGEVRESMLMLAWSLALCDEHLEDSERNRLAAFAQGLGIDLEKAQLLCTHAQEELIDTALESAYRSGKRDEACFSEVAKLAEAIGLDADHIAATDVRYRKRNNLF